MPYAMENLMELAKRHTLSFAGRTGKDVEIKIKGVTTYIWMWNV